MESHLVRFLKVGPLAQAVVLSRTGPKRPGKEGEPRPALAEGPPKEASPPAAPRAVLAQTAGLGEHAGPRRAKSAVQGADRKRAVDEVGVCVLMLEGASYSNRLCADGPVPERK